MEKRECWYVVWKYEFRSGVFMTLTRLAKELRKEGVSYWTLNRVFKKERQSLYMVGKGIEIHRSVVYK